MKLQAKYNRITIFTTLLILLLAAIGTYFVLRYVLIKQLDEDLKVEEVEILDHINRFNELPPASVYKDQRISFSVSGKLEKRRFHSLELFDSTDKKKKSIRQLLFPVFVKGQPYVVSVSKSEEATQDLVWIILGLTVTLIAVLTIMLFLINRLLFQKLWLPFRHTLSAINNFKLSAPVILQMPPTDIYEFKELNNNIRLMTDKVMKDYQSLKNFTDHASHEMQTPLAVMNSKLDVLIQEPELSEKSMGLIQGLYAAVDKLSRLNKSLLVLARIENNQYKAMEEIRIDGILKEKQIEMQELFLSAHIKITMNLAPLNVRMNKELADIMISNLVRNSLLHNEAGGALVIETAKDRLMVSNPGRFSLNEEKIFKRFYKSEKSEGSGLGLAIVQQICELYGFHSVYEFENGWHRFSIYFGKSL